MECELLPLEPWLRGYLLLSSCPASDIDDVVQECFLRIFAAPSIDEVPNPRGLLKRVARNLLIDRHRRRRPASRTRRCSVVSIARVVNRSSSRPSRPSATTDG